MLVTNDDGVRAPGLAALAAVLARGGHEVLVVAPLEDYSGASAAVGPVYARDGVAYEAHELEGAPGVPAYGIDGPPALAVILACVGGFGPMPELVVSGVNHGANLGRSAMHSGTVGAALTGSHFGLRGMAVSIRWGEDPVPWETATTLALGLIEPLARAPEGTVWNLNAPDVPLAELRGVRRGRLGRGGTIRSAVHEGSGRERSEDLPHISLPPLPAGMLRLDLSAPGWSTKADPTTDAGLLAQGYASLTPLVGVRDAGEEADPFVEAGIASLEAELSLARRS
jgi:5'-nucleotidase